MKYQFRAAMALLLTFPIIGCEPESIMDRSADTAHDPGDEIANTIEDARDETVE